MPSVPYFAADGSQRQRNTVSGDGSIASPDVFDSTTDILNLLGAQNNPIATTPQATASLIALVKRIAQDLADTELVLSPGNFQTAAAVTVGVAATTILDVDVSGFDSVGLVIQNTGTVALNSFTTAIRFHPSSFFNPKLTSAADYTTNSGLQTGNATVIPMEASVSPVALAGGSATSWLRLNVRGIESLRFTASVASGTTTLTLLGNGK